MRISDWSSDVCSSDLFLRYGSLSRGDGEGRGPPEPADPEGELNRLRYGLRGHNAFAFTVELPHHVHSGIAGRNWVANGHFSLELGYREGTGGGGSRYCTVDAGYWHGCKSKDRKRTRMN